MLEKILNWLDKKNSVILSIASLIIVFLMKDGTISQNLGLLFQGILSILTGGAVYATNNLNTTNSLGIRKPQI